MPEGKDKFRTLDDPEPTSGPLDPNCINPDGSIWIGNVRKDQITAGTINWPLGEVTTVPGEKLGFHSPRYKTRLIINCGYQILYEQPMPNRFRRFWYWFLLGWKWENL